MPVSLEMRIGSTWLVRVGIVALLTGFVFLAGYLYQYVVPHLGPAGKVALLYLGAGALTGLGAWLEHNARKRNASGLLNYARVVFGGGLAAVYYVTYAAHANAGLRVIENAFVAGVLQLGWAAFIVWQADRRDSQTLATFAILLGYFTSAANEVGTFTLFSNLALTVAAVFLLSRHRWTAFSFASLTATYGSYIFWRSQHPLGAGRHEPATFWLELIFFALYWALFTVAVFRTTPEKLPPGRRATFATLNNGAFFTLAAARLHWTYPDNFWLLCVSFGALLVALSLSARLSHVGVTSAPTGKPLWLPLDDATTSTYRLLGLALVTLGIVNYYVRGNYYARWNLVLMLALESVVLTLAACAQARAGRRLLPACACSVGFLAFGYAFDLLNINAHSAHGPMPYWKAVMVGGSLFAAFLFNAYWSRRTAGSSPKESAVSSASSSRHDWLPVAVWVFSSLAALTLLTVLDTQTLAPMSLRPAALAAGALLLTALAYPLRVDAVAVFAQVLGIQALARFVELRFMPQISYLTEPLRVIRSEPAAVPWWSALSVATVLMALCHWWQLQRRFTWSEQVRLVLSPLTQSWLAVGAVSVFYLWLQPRFPAPVWMALCAALAVVVLGYGLLTRSWAMTGASQLFLLAAVAYFLEGIVCALSPKPTRLLMLAPVAATLAVPALARRFQLFWKLADDAVPVRVRTALHPIGIGYEIATLLMFLGWTEEFVPAWAQFAALAASGAVVFVLAYLLRQQRWLGFGAGLTLAGVFAFGFHELAAPLSVRFSWWHLLAIAALAAQQVFARRIEGTPPPPPTPNAPPPLPLPRLPEWGHHALMILAAFCAWRWLTDLLALTVGGNLYLVAGWSLFAAALFAAGLFLRERTYRWLGLGVLATTLGRVAVVEFWQADTLQRNLGLLALGGVLLWLGFVYNRYAAKLREWL